jgi:hypothetical protein
MEKKKTTVDVIREFKEKHKETRQISLFDLYEIEDIVIKVRKKDEQFKPKY